MAAKTMVYLKSIDIWRKKNNWEVISNSCMPQDMVQEKQQKKLKIVYNHNLKSWTPKITQL